MSTSLFVVMQKRRDGHVYADLHKCLPEMFLTPEDAQKALDADPELAPYRHVVELVACTREEYNQLVLAELLVTAYGPIVKAAAEVGSFGPGGSGQGLTRQELRNWARRVLANTEDL